MNYLEKFLTAEGGDKYFKTLQQYGPEDALAELVVIGLGTVWKGFLVLYSVLYSLLLQ